jgi:hypothetical protein
MEYWCPIREDEALTPVTRRTDLKNVLSHDKSESTQGRGEDR